VSVRKVGPVLLVLLFAMWLPSGSFAELAKWDQERVTTLGEELAKTCGALYDTFLKQPASTVGSERARDYHRLRQIVRRVRDEARHLSAALARGEGYEPTLPVYEELMAMVRDAREIANRTFSSSSVLDRAVAAGDSLRRLGPYYDPGVLEGG
jgi:hypothetical protein